MSSLIRWLCLLLFVAKVSAADRPPNVVLIFSDDQGTLDLNCYGAKDLETPHLDKLARRGVRFTQFYTASPVCSPSRVALLTGRFPIRAGLNTNAPNYPGQPGMPTSEWTLAEMLKKQGYQTALFGKWHLGTTPECEPNGQGFDEFFGHKAGCIDNYSHYFYWQEPHVHDLYRNDREVFENGTHFSELITREARRFIVANQSKPFFLYLPFNIPHYPTQAPDRFRKRYEHLPEPRRSYAATVSLLDDCVGQVLRQLEDSRLTRKTLVIFLSDHGHSTEARASFGAGFAGDFRGAKFTMLEAGLRVPCIASWPGVIPENEVRDQLAVSFDWFPTIAEFCGAQPGRKIDGQSLRYLLKNGSAPSPHEWMHWKLGDQWAVRNGEWKLIVNGLDTKQGSRLPETTFLANLAQDPTEKQNFAKDHPEKIRLMTEKHELWLKSLRE